MGIRFLDSILALVTTSMIVFSAYLIGHALSTDHAAWAWMSAAVLLLAAALLGWFTSRRVAAYARDHGEQPKM